jgi:glycosyltransferase involved in cell wall biosynthesis
MQQGDHSSSTAGSARPDTPLISLVVPVYNEEACVEEMAARIRAVFADTDCKYELIFVNDGSRDETFARLVSTAAADANVRYISFSRNFGHQYALAAGIDHAFGDAVVTLDGDLQHPPELIPDLIAHWRGGDDVVYTIRESNAGHALKELVSKLFYWTMRKLTGVQVPTGGADFRLIDRKVADYLRQCREHAVFVRGLIPWLGFRSRGIRYHAHERFGGETKYLPTQMIRFALDGVFSFSTVPLRLISIMGAVTIALGFVYGTYSVLIRLFTDQAVSGWTSLMIIVLVFSGTQLLSLGILSEYVGRVYDEVKHRPRYVIADKSPQLDDREGGGSK